MEVHDNKSLFAVQRKEAIRESRGSYKKIKIILAFYKKNLILLRAVDQQLILPFNFGFLRRYKEVPIYEYSCQGCHQALEIRQKFSDEPLTICPACGGTLEKLLSTPALVFKGAGWYCNEFPSADRKKGLEKEKAAATTVPAATSCSSKGGNGSCGNGSCKG